MGNRTFRVSLAVALGAAAVMMIAPMALGSHVRPKAASPVRVSLVPASTACTAPNRTHGPPLAFPSCSPATQLSQSLTVGTPDANGAAANSVATTKIQVIAGAPGPPEDSDVQITADSSDIRCKPSTTACGAANAIGGADYTGQVQGSATIRVTDHFNGVAAGGGTDAATMVDIPFPVPATCVSTASTAEGSRCQSSTSANAVVPGAVKDTKRSVIEIGQIIINDGGPDGQNATAPNTVFGVQGVFIP
jgi:hypothetical protein